MRDPTYSTGDSNSRARDWANLPLREPQDANGIDTSSPAPRQAEYQLIFRRTCTRGPTHYPEFKVPNALIHPLIHPWS